MTHAGFADVLTSAGRRARAGLYALEPKASPVPMPSAPWFGIAARTAASGRARSSPYLPACCRRWAGGTRERSLSILERLAAVTDDDIGPWLASMRESDTAELADEGVARADIAERISAALRYAGQSASLNLLWQIPNAPIAAFHDADDARYGHRFDLSWNGSICPGTRPNPSWLSRCRPRCRIAGPAIVREAVTTTWDAPG